MYLEKGAEIFDRVTISLSEDPNKVRRPIKLLLDFPKRIMGKFVILNLIFQSI